jgi:hypothetical protein
MLSQSQQPVPQALFPVGTPVCVTETVRRRDRATQTRTYGTVEAWDELPTGSWYAHGKDDRLWLRRLELRKADGEISLLVVDDSTSIAKLEAVSKSS